MKTDTIYCKGLTWSLAAVLFWIGLGVGTNVSDARYWVDSTWCSVYLELGWIFLYVLLKRDKLYSAFIESWHRHSYLKLLVLWMLVVVTSYTTTSLYSFSNPLAWMRLVETFTHVMMFVMLVVFFKYDRPNPAFLFVPIIVSAICVLLYFIYININYPDLEAERHVFSIRSNQLWLNTHVHRVGYWIEAALVLMGAFMVFTKPLQRFFAIVIAAMLFLFLVWLGGRAALFGAVIGLMGYFFTLKSMRNIKHLLFWCLGIVIGTGLYFLIVGVPEYVQNAYFKTFHAASLNAVLSGRLDVWQLAIDALKGHWLIGNGPQSYFFYIGRNDEVLHAHNFVIQMLGEWGVVGAGLFLYLLGSMFYSGWKIHKKIAKNECYFYHASAGSAIIALSITGLFSGIYFFHQTEMLLAVFFAFWVMPSCAKVNIDDAT